MSRVEHGLCIAGLMVLLVQPLAVADAAQSWPILAHDIEANIDPEKNHLEVVDRLTLAEPPTPQAVLHLLLHRDLQLEAAEINGTSLEVDERQGFQPRHFWDRPDYERLDDFAIARQISLRPPAAGWPEQPEITLRYAGAIYDSLRPPEVAYGRSFETTTGLIGEQGAYLASSTFWIPWTGDNQVFRFRLRARVPAGWESISQGTWAERKVVAEGRVESLWLVEDPMEEAYLIAGPYVVRETAHDNVKVYTFTYDNTPESLCQTYLDATGRYLEMYEDMIGPYPFDKFAMVENWWQTGYGMPSFTLLGDRVIRLPFIVDTSYGHEILHNWWGNGVFVDEREGNWCEGLTTYLADYTYKAREDEAAARDYRLGRLQGYLDYAGSGGHDFALRRFTERTSPSTQAVGYGKTMMVFHMARQELGDEAFFAGLRSIYKDHLFKEATWDDIVRGFEVASGRPLATWFEQWIGRVGAPFLSVVRGDAANDATWIEVRQEAPHYDLAVEIRYEVDGEVHSQRVQLEGATTRVQLEPGTQWVAVDPDFEIFRRLHRSEIPPALSQILGVDSTLVVIGSRCPTELATELRKLAADWSRNHNQILVDEADFAGTRGRGVWLFGEGEQVDALFERTRSFGDAPSNLRRDATQNRHSLVASFRDADHSDIPWTVVLPADAAVVEALGRKLPHYSSYSYLVFEGETNIGKGKWQVESSPLRLDFTQIR